MDTAELPDTQETKPLFRINRIRVLIFLTVAFVLTPVLCVLGWLSGYGPGGVRELQWEATAVVEWTLFTAPVPAFIVFVPKTSTGKAVAVWCEGVVLCLHFCGWFLLAAAIAAV